MKSTKLSAGEYRITSSIGVFVIRKLQNVAATDFQWGVFSEDHEVIEFGYTKTDCEYAIQTWEEGTPVPAAQDYNFKYPSYIGSKRIDSNTYRMDTPVGVFIIRSLPNRRRGDFRWGIFSEQGDFFADHFTRADSESLIRDWVAHDLRPTASAFVASSVPSQSPKTKSGCLSCAVFFASLAYVLYRIIETH